MKKLGIIALVFIGVFFVARQAVMPNLVERGFQRMVSQRIGVNPVANLDDGLHVYICGAGSPLADPKRSGPSLVF